MREVGVDISAHTSKHMNEFLARQVETVMRVCGNADQACPVFPGQLNRHHWPFLDPAHVRGSELEILNSFRQVRDEMRRSPSLLGLDKLLEAQLLEAPVQRRGDLELVKTLVHQHTRTLAMYKCDNCGFRAHQFYWHCPACGEWETYSPRRTEEKGLPA